MVVQCPTCQSKFRIADDKVTDRGVRVRCTSCKNVFQVRKPGAAAGEPMPGPGNTVQLSALEAQQLTRAGARPGAAAAKPAVSRPPPPPSRPAPTARGTNGAARRLDADDLFGMAELTGDAPLRESGAPPPPLPSKPPPPPPAPAKAGAKAMPNFDDIDIEVPDEPAPPPLPSRGPPPPPPKATKPPPPPSVAVAPPPPPSEEEDTSVSPPPDGMEENGPVKIGAFNTQLKDPFEGMDMGEPGTGALELSTQPKRDKLADAVKAEADSQPPLPAKPPEPEMPPAKAMVSSALTGMVGAALAIAVVIVSAISDDAAAGWLGLTPGSEVVATKVVSGLYDTAGGKPVFFIRGKVENRGARVRGPVRVTAELMAGDSAEAKAETIAGIEPTPEDVWSLKSSADVEKLNKSMEMAHVTRKLPPGTSLPFFAVISDPPADLGRHRLHVKVESIDAWNPPAPGAPSKAAKGK